jgi:UDP-N-acetylglucosamine--N-acetylmuramyl-(pentapeptide) pyrophosphoryl-undecaprenol N-acetylglucosamine transferase
MNMVISGGGTGGHLSPALALGEELRRMRPDCKLFYIGTASPLDELFLSRSGFPYKLLQVSGVMGHGRHDAVLAVGRLIRATFAARRLLEDQRPQVVVGVGGYASMPAALAALSLRIPLVLMEQNTRPGLTNRLLARFARRVCVAFDESARWLPAGKVEVTGNPIRFQPVNNPDPHPDKFSILVLGGSSGAHRLNIGAVEAFNILKKDVIKFEITHQTGVVDEGLVRTGYQQAGIDARVLPFIYEQDMAGALAQADLVVARAGAMTVCEVALAGRPAIFVPYPFHRDHQQEHNARNLERVGAALIVKDDNDLAQNLSRAVTALMHDRQRLSEMGRRARQASRPDAAARIARTCLSIAEAA